MRKKQISALKKISAIATKLLLFPRCTNCAPVALCAHCRAYYAIQSYQNELEVYNENL